MAFIGDAERDVELFERAMNGQVMDRPAMPDRKVRELRARLMAEEVAETIAALGFDVDIKITDADNEDDVVLVDHVFKPGKIDLVELADGIADAIFVDLGTAVAAGIDMEPVWDEVVRTNLSKASGPVRADGKRLKPEGWQPPRIAEIIADQQGCDFGCCGPVVPNGCVNCASPVCGGGEGCTQRAAS